MRQGLSQNGLSPGVSPWTIRVEACAIVGVIPRSAATERVPMPTIPQRIASAFAVLCGRYGDVTRMAKDREQSRQSLYREAEKVVEAVDGTAAEARIDELAATPRRPGGRESGPSASGWSGPSRSPATSRTSSPPSPRPRGSASASPAGSCRSWPDRSPSRAWRRWGGRPSRPVEHAGALLEVLDEAARPRVEQAAADEIFWAEPGPDGGRAREPLLDDRPDGRGPRRRHLGSRSSPGSRRSRPWSATTAPAWVRG